MRRTTPEDFLSRLRPVGECLEYVGSRPRGYGQLSWQGRTQSAHRLAWIIANGPIPDGLWVLHRCDNPPCCRIEHLYLGTHRDNERDVMQRRRSHLRSHPGATNQSAVLTADQVREIRESPLNETQLAARFPVSRSQIGRIRRGERWQTVA